jgi:hypothetical protein
MAPRAFTVAEANRLIPVMESVLDEIAELWAQTRRRHEQLQVLDVLWGEKVTRPGTPDHPEWEEHREAITAAVNRIEELVEGEILGRGVRFPQGGLEHGLIDFPTTWEGRWVYLCWKKGERRLTAWHEVDGGYAGRHELTDDQAERMGLEDDPAELDDHPLDF